MTHPAKTFLVLGVQTRPHELFIHLFLCLPLPPHRQWHHMGVSLPTWYGIQKPPLSPLTITSRLREDILQLDLPHEIRHQLLVLHQALFQDCQHLTSLEQQPEQQQPFLFDQNKDRILPTIHSQRKNSVRSSRLTSRLYTLFLYQSLKKFLLMASIQKTQTRKWHPGLPQSILHPQLMLALPPFAQ